MKRFAKRLADSAAAGRPDRRRGPACRRHTLPEWPFRHIDVESIDPGEYDAQMVVGTTQQLKPIVLPEDASDPEVTFASDDLSIVQVSQDGLIGAASVGTHPGVGHRRRRHHLLRDHRRPRPLHRGVGHGRRPLHRGAGHRRGGQYFGVGQPFVGCRHRHRQLCPPRMRPWPPSTISAGSLRWAKAPPPSPSPAGTSSAPSTSASISPPTAST